MLHVFPLRDDSVESFKKLFTAYYAELGCDDDCEHLISEYILPDLLAGLIRIDMLTDGGKPAGFAVYQIDDVDNDWNKREGWGDIREIYIVPGIRRQGAGRLLLLTAEMRLRESGADKAYCLPTEAAEPFFKACGYKKTGDFEEEVECFVYEKSPLNSKCSRNRG